MSYVIYGVRYVYNKKKSNWNCPDLVEFRTERSLFTDLVRASLIEVMIEYFKFMVRASSVWCNLFCVTSPRSWTVVVFEEDQTVQAVPTKWINGDQCLWPTLPQDKLNVALKNCDYNTCWPHKIRILRNGTFGKHSYKCFNLTK